MSPRKAKQNSANVKDFSEAQTVRDHQEANGHSIASSVREISIIETMESFLEENGASEVDPKVLRVLAETLTKRFQDTSPGTLQDVTMDQSYGTGYRSQPSCQGNVSPSSHGRSVREFEEQMAALHKENFNLKLKLFFLEESVPGYKQTQANNSDPVLKQLIEKKVENEMLRKDLQDNQSLLRDSMHTIEELEKMIQIKTMECKTQIDELNHKINFYEMERELQQESNQLSGLNESKEASRKLEQAEEQINDLTAALQRSEEQIEDFQSQISKLDNILLERDETIAQLHEELAQLKSENNDLKSAKANKSEQLDRIESKINAMEKQLSNLSKSKISLIESYETVKTRLNNSLFVMVRTLSETALHEHELMKFSSLIDQRVNITERLMERVNEYEKLLRNINENQLQRTENRFYRVLMRQMDQSSLPSIKPNLLKPNVVSASIKKSSEKTSSSGSNLIEDVVFLDRDNVCPTPLSYSLPRCPFSDGVLSSSTCSTTKSKIHPFTDFRLKDKIKRKLRNLNDGQKIPSKNDSQDSFGPLESPSNRRSHTKVYALKDDSKDSSESSFHSSSQNLYENKSPDKKNDSQKPELAEKIENPSNDQTNRKKPSQDSKNHSKEEDSIEQESDSSTTDYKMVKYSGENEEPQTIENTFDYMDEKAPKTLAKDYNWVYCDYCEQYQYGCHQIIHSNIMKILSNTEYIDSIKLEADAICDYLKKNGSSRLFGNTQDGKTRQSAFDTRTKFEGFARWERLMKNPENICFRSAQELSPRST